MGHETMPSLALRGGNLSPIDTLPVELVQEICIACVDTNQNHSVSRDEAPLLLIRISRRIRQIALSTPALWATIHIHYGSFRGTPIPSKSRCMKQLSLNIKMWLCQHSGTVPLNISIRDDRRAPILHSISDGVTKNILACCSRWRVLSVQYPSARLMSRITALDHATVPLLQSITFHFNITDGAVFRSGGMFRARNLKELSLRCGRGNFNVVQCPVNWSNLTHLELRENLWTPSSVTSSIAHILQRAGHLVSCIIATDTVTECANIAEVSLPFLKVLKVDEAPSPEVPNATGILKFVNAPLLQTLSVGGLPKANSLLALLRRSPDIHELNLGSSPSTDILMDCLQYCPSLTALRIQNIDGDNPLAGVFLEAFALEDVHGCLCPALDVFVCGAPLRASVETVSRFYMRKQGHVPGLRRWKTVALYITADGCTQDEMESLIAEVRVAGGLQRRMVSLDSIARDGCI